jgi:hypothetical protein
MMRRRIGDLGCWVLAAGCWLLAKTVGFESGNAQAASLSQEPEANSQ